MKSLYFQLNSILCLSSNLGVFCLYFYLRNRYFIRYLPSVLLAGNFLSNRLSTTAGIQLLFLLWLIRIYTKCKRLNQYRFVLLWLTASIFMVFSQIMLIFHDSTVRSEYDWIMVSLSTLSIIFQFFCSFYLRSSIAFERHVVLQFAHGYDVTSRDSYLSQKISVNEYKVSSESKEGERTDILSSQVHHTFDQLKSNLEAVHVLWENTISELKQTLLSWSGNTDDSNGFETTLNLILRLYLNEINSSDMCRELEIHFLRFPHQVEFYVPQLTVFVLYGSFEHSEALQVSMLSICRRSSSFAYKLFWFISAFCLNEAGVSKCGVLALNKFLGSIERNANPSCPDGVDDTIFPTCMHRNTRGYGSFAQTSALECSQNECWNQEFDEDESACHQRNSSFINRERFRIIPTFSLFRANTYFWNRLIFISRQLSVLPIKSRSTHLQHSLRILNNVVFKDECTREIYFPFDSTLKICRLLPSESKVFSSKKRAPCLICMEVIDKPQNLRSSMTNFKLIESASKVLSIESAVTEDDTKNQELCTQTNLKKEFTWKSLNVFSEIETSGTLNNIQSNLITESWENKEDRHRSQSAFGKEPGWRLVSIIVKSGDDLRQEQCASQIIQIINVILESKSNVEYWLYPYKIIAISPDSGLIQAIPNTISLDAIRKNSPRFQSLLHFFEEVYGPKTSAEFIQAQKNFIISIASYSMVTYILQLKDRHNGNLLLDSQGHLIHIDFGFFFGDELPNYGIRFSIKASLCLKLLICTEQTPGGNLGFESSPFKLTDDFIDVMGGVKSDTFKLFRKSCENIFLAIRSNYFQIIIPLQMFAKGNEHLECFGGYPQVAIDNLKSRFFPDLNDTAVKEKIQNLVNQSINNWTTAFYDDYQKCCSGVF